MTRLLVVLAALTAGGLIHPTVARGQQPVERDTSLTLRVFVDCRTRCDFDFFRREIPFVNYTRDREDSEVHVLITSQSTGAGGSLFSLDFIGRELFEGIDERLETITPPSMAEEQVLSALTNKLKFGLLRYVARTPLADRIQVVFEEAGHEPVVSEPDDDPWNFWVFRVNANGQFNAQERTDFVSIFGGVSASRVTEDLRVQFGTSASYSKSNFDVSDTLTITSSNEFYDGTALTVWSLGGQWGIGGQFAASHSTFSNEDLVLRLAPGLEYNLYPYSESTRRQLRFFYSVGLTRFRFIEETIFFRTEQTVPDHRFSVSLDVRQPWGSSNISLQAVQILNDLDKNRLSASGSVSLRAVKGLSVNISGSASRVNDQINLPAGDATEEEVLLRQRELETGFSYRLSIGFSYTFGSIFSNVVNPRFGGSTRSFIRRF